MGMTQITFYAALPPHSHYEQRTSALHGRHSQKPLCCAPSRNALVAQLDRVLVSEAKGRGFDSRRARHQIKSPGDVWHFAWFFVLPF